MNTVSKGRQLLVSLGINSNPWLVKSLQDLTFICCPECVFKSNDPVSFECHALENHPRSTDFFPIDKATVVLNRNVISKYAIEHKVNLINSNDSIESTYPDVKIEEEVHNEDQDPLYLGDIESNETSKNISSVIEQEHARQSPLTEVFLPKIEKSLKTNDDSFMDEATFSDEDQIMPDSSDKNDAIVIVEPQPIDEGLQKTEKSSTKTKIKQILEIKDLPSKHTQQCLVCLKDFESTERTIRHIIDDHPKITCGKCDLVLENYTLLARHNRAEHQTTIPKKKVRKRKKSPNDDAPKHPKKSRKKDHFVCKKCPYETNTHSNLKSHYYENHRYDRKVWEGVAKDKNEIIQCEVCQIYVKAKGYLIHFKKAHGDKLPSHFVPGEKHVCEFCSAEFQYLFYLKRHIEKHHSTNSQSNEMKKCHLCKQEFGTRGYLKHYRQTHNCFPPGYEDKPKYFCDQCGKVFATKPVLDSHVRAIHSERKWTCRFCPEEFDSVRDLTRHNYEHHSSELLVKPVKNPQTCKLCNVEFKAFAGYMHHYRSFHNSFPPGYEDQQKFSCAECDKVYLSRKSLMDHRIRIHTEGFKPKKPTKKALKTCEYCSKTFVDAQCHLEHVKVKHENVHNYECEVCSKKFYIPSFYKCHFAARHDKDPCPICKGGPFNKRDMKRHKLKAHGIKPDTPFKCDKCGRSFEREKSLNFHNTQVHLKKQEMKK